MNIEIQHVYQHYGGVSALSNVSLSVAQGEFVSIIGPSGCGKTTLLRLIGGLITPTSGEALIGSERAGVARKKGQLGFVFQNPILLPWRSVLQNVKLPLEIVPDAVARGRDPQTLLARLGLSEFKDATPRQLSGGMQQRVALARALVFTPDILLMDEPFGAVDELMREKLDLELRDLTEELHQTVVFVTHSLSEAALVSDRIIVLSRRPARVRFVVEVPPQSSRRLYCGSDTHLGLIRHLRGLLEDDET